MNHSNPEPRRKVLKMLAAGGSVALGGISVSRLAQAQVETIRVGFPVPLTGAFEL